MSTGRFSDIALKFLKHVSDGRSISQQADKDAAWYNVVTDLGAVLDR